MLASVVTGWQKKRELLAAHFSEDCDGVRIVQLALYLTDRLLNQERLLRFQAKSVCSTKRQ
jgi:hypothetical protein